jgi:hypothetical protein
MMAYMRYPMQNAITIRAIYCIMTSYILSQADVRQTSNAKIINPKIRYKTYNIISLLFVLVLTSSRRHFRQGQTEVEN